MLCVVFWISLVFFPCPNIYSKKHVGFSENYFSLYHMILSAELYFWNTSRRDANCHGMWQFTSRQVSDKYSIGIFPKNYTILYYAQNLHTLHKKQYKKVDQTQLWTNSVGKKINLKHHVYWIWFSFIHSSQTTLCMEVNSTYDQFLCRHKLFKVKCRVTWSIWRQTDYKYYGMCDVLKGIWPCFSLVYKRMTNAKFSKYSNVSPKRSPTRGQTDAPAAKMRWKTVQRLLQELPAPRSVRPSDHLSLKIPKCKYRVDELERHDCRTACRNSTNTATKLLQVANIMCYLQILVDL